MTIPDRFRRWLSSACLWPLVLALLVACSAQPPAPAQPVSIEVRLPPELSSATLTSALELCAGAQPELELSIQAASETALTPGGADLALTTGSPPEGVAFSAPLAVQELVIIVHPENPLQRLDLEDVQAIFRGRLTSWDELGGPDRSIQPWSYFQGVRMESVFRQVFLQDAPIASLTLLANEPEAVRQAVADDRGAIGYVPRAWLDDSVRPISLEQEVRAGLRQPVIASTAGEPQGTLRAFLYCLQSGPGHDVLMQSYLAWPGS